MSESKFWSKLAISRESPKDILQEGIISKEKPLSFPYENFEIGENEKVNVLVNEKIGKNELYFFLENSRNPSGNSHLLDPKLYDKNINIKVVDSEDPEKILGIIVSIPHTGVLVSNDKNELPQVLEFCATSNLCVAKSHRSRELAAVLISGVINKGFEEGMYVGYHFIKEPRSSSSIKIVNYYRPLDVSLALDNGFDIPSFYNKDLLLKKNFNEEKQKYKASDILAMEQEYYIPKNKDYIIEDSIYSDLDFLTTQNRKLYVTLDELRFEDLRKIFIWKTVKNIKTKKIVGLFCYKPKIMVIGASKKSCLTASMILIELNSLKKDKITYAILEYLKDQNFITVNGSLLGPLYDEDLRKNLHFVACGYQYLDFYNFQVNLENNPSKFNLLYF